MSFVLPAPRLPGDAALEIFVFPGNQTAARPLEESNKFSDSHRLEYLGRVFTTAAYTDVMFRQWPELQTIVANSLDRFMERHATAYQWGQRVHGYPPNFNRQSLAEACRLFCTYAGAVFVEHGFAELRTWIAHLVEMA